MRKIDEGQFIKLIPDDGMILTDVATETMRAAEIDLGKNDNINNYKDILIESEPENDIFEMSVQGEDYNIENINNILTQINQISSNISIIENNLINLQEDYEILAGGIEELGEIISEQET